MRCGARHLSVAHIANEQQQKPDKDAESVSHNSSEDCEASKHPICTDDGPFGRFEPECSREAHATDNRPSEAGIRGVIYAKPPPKYDVEGKAMRKRGDKSE